MSAITTNVHSFVIYTTSVSELKLSFCNCFAAQFYCGQAKWIQQASDQHMHILLCLEQPTLCIQTCDVYQQAYLAMPGIA